MNPACTLGLGHKNIFNAIWLVRTLEVEEGLQKA